MNAKEYERLYNDEENHWWFKGRRQVVEHLVQRIKKKKNIMDFGCGTGINSILLKKYGKVTSTDVSPEAKKFCQKRNVEVTLIDILHKNTDRFENKYDLIVAMDVIEHIDEDEKILEKLRGFLDKNGRLLITVPAEKYLWSNHDKTHHHKRRYSKKELKNKLQKAGFKIELFSYYQMFIYPASLIRSIFNIKSSSVEATNIKINLSWMYAIEEWLVKKHLVPVGTSFVVIAKK